MSLCRVLAILGLGVGLLGGAAAAATDDTDSCLRHIDAAEKSAGIPEGLLEAIGLAESGRDMSGGRREPWPWTVNARGQGYYFDSKDDAIAFVRDLQAQGVTVIDVGCLQVNLYYHPDAFASLDAAFDPATNVAYAAAFLNELGTETGDWSVATQYYHSRTPALGEAYARRVADGRGGAAVSAPVLPLSAAEKAALRAEIDDQLLTSDELIARAPARRPRLSTSGALAASND